MSYQVSGKQYDTLEQAKEAAQRIYDRTGAIVAIENFDRFTWKIEDVKLQPPPRTDKSDDKAE